MLISNWIDGRNGLSNLYNFSYYYELIFRGSQEGFSKSIFEKKCLNIKQTIVIMKLKETGKLIGGYNPACWSVKEMSPDESYRTVTDKSFIFKIDQNQINNSILSRIKDPEYAIGHPEKKLEMFAIFGNVELAVIRRGIDDVSYCYNEFKYYENDLNLKCKDKKAHLLEELEVYKLTHV